MNNDFIFGNPFPDTSTGNTTREAQGDIQYNPPPDQYSRNNETFAGFNEVQKSLITQMVNESMVNTISKPQLPNFFKDKPELWFILIESEFQATKTTNDDMKYYSVIRALDADMLQQITGILHDPPVVEKYKKIKEALIQRTSVSRDKQIRQLLTSMDLGDKKPTQLLREMKELAGESMTEDMLHQLWLDRMPNQIKPLLVVSSTLTLKALAEVADRVLEASRSSFVMATTAYGQKDASISTTHNRLEQRLDNLQQMLMECMKEIKEMKYPMSMARRQAA
ncbi:hypothetical protein HCN44_010889 [Aphidius gifuensis]|uniref:DUF7041 domain-containing protein n=1 Tax=Aphidius gifuensis TaxID=684658 RepID=A0A834XPG3_APHGI|nr:hypothetical protein HCN44_010889 [Aphidius gifuensis]